MTLLSSLAKRELLCGFAEIIKHALIADADMFRYLEENCSQALALNPQVIEKPVSDSIKIKPRLLSGMRMKRGGAGILPFLKR